MRKIVDGVEMIDLDGLKAIGYDQLIKQNRKLNRTCVLCELICWGAGLVTGYSIAKIIKNTKKVVRDEEVKNEQ